MVKEDLQWLLQRCGNSPALLRVGGKPVFYLYDSYKIPNDEWRSLLDPYSNVTLRGTLLDGVFLGLWLDANDGDSHIAPSQFDGFYTYFASDGVSHGARPDSWRQLAAWARANGRLFVPSVGPGYNDTKIRPWNEAASRDRLGGKRCACS